MKYNYISWGRESQRGKAMSKKVGGYRTPPTTGTKVVKKKPKGKIKL